VNVDDGNRYMPDTLNYWSYTGVNPNVDDEKLARILYIYDFFAGPDGKEFAYWGVEGKDFEREGDGYVSLLPVDEVTGKHKRLSEVDRSSGFGRSMVTWNTDAGLSPLYSGIDADVLKDTNDYFDMIRSQCVSPGTNFSVAIASTPAKDRLPSPAGEFCMEYQRIVMSDDDVEAMWTAWVNEQKELYKEAIDEINAMFP